MGTATPADGRARTQPTPASLLEAVWLSPIAFALLDPALRVVAANPALVTLLQRAPARGDAIVDLLPAWLSGVLEGALRDLSAAGACAAPLHLRADAPSGVAWTAFAYASPRGEGLYVAVVPPGAPDARPAPDVAGLADALHVAVEEWDAALRRQEELHAQLDALFAAAPIGVALFDRDLRFARVNDALARLDGVPVEEHLGRRLDEVVPGMSEALLEGYRDVLERGASEVDVPVSGWTPSDPDRTRHFVASRYPVRVRGEIAGVGTVVREVTAEREAELYRRDVLGIVGHDLRTPLHAIRGSLAIALRSPHLDATTRASLERAERVSARMGRIVSDLLDYTLSHSPGGIPVTPVPTPILPLCREALSELRAASAGRAAQLLAEADARALVAVADPDRLLQALMNLLSNAVRYGAPSRPVTLAVRGDGQRVCLEVGNEGPPIPAELLPALFEPFRRGRTARTADGGVGLGLHIARSIARAHGGDVTGDSSDTGTRFRITIPRYVDE